MIHHPKNGWMIRQNVWMIHQCYESMTKVDRYLIGAKLFLTDFRLTKSPKLLINKRFSCGVTFYTWDWLKVTELTDRKIGFNRPQK